MRRSGLTFINLFQYWFRFIYCSYYITWPRDHWPVPTITCTPCSSKVGPDASNHNLNVCKITKLLWQRIGCWLWRAGSPELSALTEVIILGVIPKYSASSILKYTSIFKKNITYKTKSNLGWQQEFKKSFFDWEIHVWAGGYRRRRFAKWEGILQSWDRQRIQSELIE